MKDQNHLDNHSSEALGFIASDFPEILKYASVQKSDRGDSFLKIEIDSPNKSAEHGIYIDTQDNMFTVGFDCFHCHFFQFAGTDFHSELSRAIHIVSSILENDLFVVKCLKDGKYARSFLIEKDKANRKDIQKRMGAKKDYRTTKIVSWTGEFDSEIVLKKKWFWKR